MCRSCDCSKEAPFESSIKALVAAVSRRKEGAEVSLNDVSVMHVHLPSGAGNLNSEIGEIWCRARSVWRRQSRL